MKTLSIISPYYNALPYILDLAKTLEPQLTDEVEWLIVDDGCDEKELDNLKATVIHMPTNSGGASTPRNIGIEKATGEYIAFIDADDLITEDYINIILSKIHETNFDICYVSWKSDMFSVIMNKEPPSWNCSVWSRVYKRSVIGNVRFDPKLVIGEDYKFNANISASTIERITKPIYYYRDTPNSLIKRGNNGT